MLSLELAKKLKSAGLEWEPKEFDIYFHPNENDYILGNSDIIPYCGIFPELVFAPRLDQLLAEIEKRGYVWILSPKSDGKYELGLGRRWTGNDNIFMKIVFIADSPEEAAAEALLWILKEAN